MGKSSTQAEKHTNTLEKFILHEKYQPRPKDCQNI